MYKKKYSKYSKILDRLAWLNACSSSLRIGSGISSVATLSTFVGLHLSIPLGAASLAGASISGVTTAPTFKYQKKLAKVMKLVDIVTSATAVFETSISKALNSGEINERRFQVLQELHLKVIKELANFGRKMESETRNQLQKISTGRDEQDKENLKDKRRLMICALFSVCYLVCYQNG